MKKPRLLTVIVASVIILLPVAINYYGGLLRDRYECQIYETGQYCYQGLRNFIDLHNDKIVNIGWILFILVIGFSGFGLKKLNDRDKK